MRIDNIVNLREGLGSIPQFFNFMSPLFKKLNFKNQKTVVLLNAPDSFLPETEAMVGLTIVLQPGDGAYCF